MKSTIRHTGLVVTDLDKAIKFWCEKMGFKLINKMVESGSHIDKMIGLNNVKVLTAKLNDSNGYGLELLEFASHKDQVRQINKPYSLGYRHIALTVKDIKSTVIMLRNEGYKCSTKIQKSPDGKVKVVYANGPEEIIIELVEERGDD